MSRTPQADAAQAVLQQYGDVTMQSVLAALDAAAAVPGGAGSFTHYDPKLQWAGSSVKRTLAAGLESLAAAFETDSTGNDMPAGQNTGDYPYELGLKVAAVHPEYTVEFDLFNDAAQDYAAPVRIQTGAAGERYINFTGAGAGFAIAKAAAQANALGDLWVEATVALDDWTPVAANTLLARFGAAGQRTCRLQVLGTSGKLYFEYSTDGTTLIGKTSSVAPTVVDGAVLTVAAAFATATGNVTFYTSTDGGATFTQLGTVQNGAGASPLFDSTAGWELGARQGTSEVLAGKFYRCKIRNGIPTSFVGNVPQNPGPIIAPILPEHWPPFSSTSPTTRSGAPIFKILAGAVSGKDLVYMSDTTRIKMMFPDWGIRIAILATSHNDGGLRDRSYVANWATWIANVKAWAYGAKVGASSQNPRGAGALNLVDHAARRDLLMSSGIGDFFYDAYQAFVDLGDYSSYINADKIHPTLAIGANGYSGAQVWANDLYAAMFTGA